MAGLARICNLLVRRQKAHGAGKHYRCIGDERKAWRLPKGGFYQQSGGNRIFKMATDGNTAFKTDIQLGNQNINYYEVLSELNPGDKVVTQV